VACAPCPAFQNPVFRMRVDTSHRSHYIKTATNGQTSTIASSVARDVAAGRNVASKSWKGACNKRLGEGAEHEPNQHA
jgi:hypothetical protein